MKRCILLAIFFATVTYNARSQSFDTWSGTIRIGGGTYGTVYSYLTPVTVILLRTFKFTNWEHKDFQNWSSEQHGAFRFFNIGGDILVPNWSMTSSNANLTLLRGEDDNFLNDPVNQYTYYVGYYFNWRSQFSGLGCFFGADYLWRNFDLHYPYPYVSHNKICSIVPTIGLRYRLLDPIKFPFNIVLEGGLSYVVNTKYDNSDGYSLGALNNGLRPILGVSIATSRYGSIHLRWTKDLYDLFNNEYHPSEGPLYNNEIYNDFSSVSIGWAIFL